MFLALRAYASCEPDPNHIGNTASDGSRAAPGAKPHVRQSDAIRPKVNALRRDVYGDLMGSFPRGVRRSVQSVTARRSLPLPSTERFRRDRWHSTGVRRRGGPDVVLWFRRYPRAPRQPMERFHADRPPR